MLCLSAHGRYIFGRYTFGCYILDISSSDSQTFGQIHLRRFRLLYVTPSGCFTFGMSPLRTLTPSGSYTFGVSPSGSYNFGLFTFKLLQSYNDLKVKHLKV